MKIIDFEPSDYDIEKAEHDADEYDRYYQERVSDQQSFEHWRKNLPPILFKYRSLNTSQNLVRVIDILKEHRLFVPVATSLNDPFEGGNVDYLSEKDKDEFEKGVKNCRVLSLSKDCFSSPLWAHYADEGAGICIGFLTFETLLCADELKYTNTIDKKQWWSIDKTDALRKEFLFKNKDWKYESEYRVIRTTSESTYSCINLKPNEIALIIFGEKIDKEVKTALKGIIPDNVLLFDIKADRNRARYYMTKCDSSSPTVYTLEELYKIVF